MQEIQKFYLQIRGNYQIMVTKILPGGGLAPGPHLSLYGLASIDMTEVSS